MKCKRMKKTFLMLSMCLILLVGANGQAKTRKFSSIINHPSVNTFAPLISADGNMIMLITDNAEDNALAPFFALRENNDWTEPVLLPKSVNTRLNFLYGFGINADGRKLYVSTLKMPSVGGFDLWVSDLKGKTWSDPQNMGAPINTKSNEACASLTTDGNTMYFMRCDKMDQQKADNCRLMVVRKKSNGQWEEPTELPASINTGNSQTPRIMADGETLIFASNKMSGGKGGMDLYVTRLKNGSWSTPVALDFVNTAADDQYVSASGLGRYLLKDTKGARKNEIMEYLIPGELRPRGMMKLEGKVADAAGAPTGAYITITDINNGKATYTGRPNADGSFLVYLMEGTTYEMAVDPEHSDFSFFSRAFDLTSDKIPQSERVDVVLKQIRNGDELALEQVRFKPNSSELESSSKKELQRLGRIIKNNPAMKFEIQVLFSGYAEDSTRSSPDLTEVVLDMIPTQVNEIDSLGQIYKKDTVMTRTRYNNDRTVAQAQAIISFLVSDGAKPDNLTYFVNAIASPAPENRKLTIRARVR